MHTSVAPKGCNHPLHPCALDSQPLLLTSTSHSPTGQACVMVDQRGPDPEPKTVLATRVRCMFIPTQVAPAPMSRPLHTRQRHLILRAKFSQLLPTVELPMWLASPSVRLHASDPNAKDETCPGLPKSRRTAPNQLVAVHRIRLLTVHNPSANLLPSTIVSKGERPYWIGASYLIQDGKRSDRHANHCPSRLPNMALRVSPSYGRRGARHANQEKQ